MTTQEHKLILENRKIYAKLMSIKEERKQLQSHLDIEIALCGSKLFHNGVLLPEDIKPTNKIFVKLVCLYEREQILMEIWRDNCVTIKEIRKHE